MATLTTRVFNNGNSQAVRIPAEFRLDTDRVLISRNEQGDLILHPERSRGTDLFNPGCPILKLNHTPSRTSSQ